MVKVSYNSYIMNYIKHLRRMAKMKRNISLLMFSIVMMFGIGISANAQINFENPSFEDGFRHWSHTSGRNPVILKV